MDAMGKNLEPTSTFCSFFRRLEGVLTKAQNMVRTGLCDQSSKQGAHSLSVHVFGGFSESEGITGAELLGLPAGNL